jgi:membrane complex biogenesis BtpA family protein
VLLTDFKSKSVIACVHLLPTPGTYNYDGDVENIYNTAVKEAKAFENAGVDALIVENFRDKPFFPDEVPNETVALIAGVGREIIKNIKIPVGVAVLRNDSEAAMSIAVSIGASFIRVNIHVGAVLSPQGIIQTKVHKTLRLAKSLRADVKIFADAGVKHSYPLVYENIGQEISDLSGISDAIIISGEKTGLETNLDDLIAAKKISVKPLFIGSGTTVENLDKYYSYADGFIVGSYFKVDGKASNFIDEKRLECFMNKISNLRIGG